MTVYQIQNRTSGRQKVIYVDGRAVTLSPGQAPRDVDLSDKEFLRHRRDKEFRISGGDADGAEQRVSEQRAANPGRRVLRPSTQVVDDGATDSERAQRLIDQFDAKEIDYRQLIEGAKGVMGSDYPGGTPRRTVIVDALRDIASRTE